VNGLWTREELRGRTISPLAPEVVGENGDRWVEVVVSTGVLMVMEWGVRTPREDVQYNGRR
jgi:hypothetical protein